MIIISNPCNCSIKICHLDLVTFMVTTLIIGTVIWLSIKTLTNRSLDQARYKRLIITSLALCGLLALCAYVYFSGNFFGMDITSDGQFWLNDMITSLSNLERFYIGPFLVLALYIANIISIFSLARNLRKLKKNKP